MAVPIESSEARKLHSHVSSLVAGTVDDIPAEFRKKYDKDFKVGIAAKVISVSHMNLAENTFQADFNLNVAWTGTKEQKPEVQFYNANELDDLEEAEVKKADCGFDFYYRLRVKGVFREKYRLQEFPFDTQNVKVRIRIKSECTLVHLPWGLNDSPFSLDEHTFEDDFDLLRAYIKHEYHPSFKFGKLGGFDPEAQVIFSLKRKPDYWVSNYGGFTSVLCTFAFAAFCLPTGEMGDRLGIGFTLNLTVVATFYLMQDKLPAVPYWTLLDRHMLHCIAFTMMVMIINCLPAFLGVDYISTLERKFIVALLAIWIGYHAKVWAKIESLSDIAEQASSQPQTRGAIRSARSSIMLLWRRISSSLNSASRDVNPEFLLNGREASVALTSGENSFAVEAE
jgi:hypothetical protein